MVVAWFSSPNQLKIIFLATFLGGLFFDIYELSRVTP